jgi:hypothetical protein
LKPTLVQYVDDLEVDWRTYSCIPLKKDMKKMKEVELYLPYFFSLK